MEMFTTRRLNISPLKFLFLALLSSFGMAVFSLWYNSQNSKIGKSPLEKNVQIPLLLGHSPSHMRGVFHTLVRNRNQVSNLGHKPLALVKNHSGLACEMPDLKPFDESIQHVITRPDSVVCKGEKLTYIKKGKVFFNHSCVRDVDYKWCSLVSLVRETDDYNINAEPLLHHFHGNTSKLKEDVELGFNVSSDFSLVTCSQKKYPEEYYGEFRQFQDEETTSKNPQDYDDDMIGEDQSTMEHTDVFAQILQNSKASTRTKVSQRKNGPGLDLNVIMLGIDSTSHMNFVRSMPKSLTYMKDVLNSVIMSGYNIVGDATTGALIPMLTGKTETELPEVRRDQKHNQNVDVYPLVWKAFKKAGYMTMFAEDRPDIAVFNLRLRGFTGQPTDHYMRTFWKDADTYRSGLCLGPDLVHNVMFDYLNDFMTSYPEGLKFGFSFLTDLTHADMNRLSLIDSDFLAFLESINKSGLLNRTLLVIFSDHGARYTKIRKTMQGKFEERLPFMSFTLPPWFKRVHPRASNNLKVNADRLATPFDIHATLESVLNFTLKQGRVQDRGISLLASEIPRDRECLHAGIADHWCSCLKWEVVTTKDDKWVKQVASFLTATINNLTHTYRQNCSMLRLSQVISSFRMVPDDKVVTFVKTANSENRIVTFDKETTAPDHYNLTITYQVTIATEPGNGQYEATVRVNRKVGAQELGFELSGAISRINLYGHNADCTEDWNPSLAKFCFCKRAGKRANIQRHA